MYILLSWVYNTFDKKSWYAIKQRNQTKPDNTFEFLLRL